jgi:hypothetical protein
MYLGLGDVGAVRLDDPASASAGLGEDVSLDLRAIEDFIDVAVEGRATAFHVGRGGCVEVRDGGRQFRTWHNAWPLPGWRRRAATIDFLPYR